MYFEYAWRPDLMKDTNDNMEFKRFNTPGLINKKSRCAPEMPRFASDKPAIPNYVKEKSKDPLLENWLREIYNASKRN